MKKHNLVSVIVPIYQVEKYIHRCVKSILNQTYRNIEVILVDDGSPDGCPEICDEYEKLDSRVIVIHQKNQGLSAARNAGLDIANGEYIFFVDSDDYIDEQVIEKLLIEAKETGADLVLCDYICVDEQGSELKEKYSKRLERKVFNITDVYSLSSEYGGEVFLVAWNKLYRKELWQQYRYPVGKIHEDEFAFHHVISQCKMVVSIGYIGYYYVQRNGSIMSKRSQKSCIDALDAYADRFEWYIKNDMDLFAINLYPMWYRLCADLYQTEKNKVVLRKYLEKVYGYQHQIAQNKVPQKYMIAYKGLWYIPQLFSALLQLYKKICDCSEHLRVR